MELENRTPDETVNYTIEHPLKEFAWLVVGAVGTVALITTLIGLFAGELAARLPYRYEKAVAVEVTAALMADRPGDNRQASREVERELNRLGARLAADMQLPEGMAITVHYQDTPMVNAFATLGANIVICRGLLEQLADENALAMVLAHEIAHAKLRHPARSLGRGVAVGIILSAIHASMGSSAASGAINTAGNASLLKFSRDQEREADFAALAVLSGIYGHVGGAQDVFHLLERANGEHTTLRVPMLSTHPLSQERIESIAVLARERGWRSDGPRVPLPAALESLRRTPAAG